jgi:fucose 4-O-acetylase-like acetyltransferase
MDFLRGSFILLVIFDHAIHHVLKSGLYAPDWLLATSLSFSPLRMPFMVFLSGMLLSRSLAKGPGPYLEGKTRNILYPYLVWSIIYTSLWVLLNPITSEHHDISEFLLILYAPQGHLWYIYFLFFYFVIMLSVDRIPRHLVLAGVATATAIASWSIGGGIAKFLFLLNFFILGDIAMRHWDRLLSVLRQPMVVTVLIAGTAVLPIVAFGLGIEIRYSPVSVPFVLTGIGLVLLIGTIVGAQRIFVGVRYIGRTAIQAYIMHWIVLAVAVRLVGALLPSLDGAGPILAVSALGIAGTTIAVIVVERLRLGFLFTPPTKLIRTTQRRPVGATTPNNSGG